MRASPRLWLAAVVVVVPALGAAENLEIASVWPAAPVRIDGAAEQWSALARPLGETPMAMAVENDGEYLYLFFGTSDQQLRSQIEGSGLTVWANGEGKTQKGFGVRFPLSRGWPGGVRGEGGGWQAGQGSDRWPRPTARRGSYAAAPAGATPDAQAATVFELIGPAENRRIRVQQAADQPIAVSRGGDSSMTVVAFRLPLRSSAAHPLSVGAAPGATIAVGVTCGRTWASRGPVGRSGQRSAPAIQLGVTDPNAHGQAAPVATQAIGGRDAGSPGGPRGGGAAAALELWVRVALATPPTPGQATPATATTARPKTEKAPVVKKAPALPATPVATKPQ